MRLDSLTLRLLILSACCICVLTVAERSCLVSDIPVQDPFDVSQYLGTWYEIMWIAPWYEPTYWVWNDFCDTYTQNSSGIFGEGRGRPTDAKPDDQCHFFTFKMDTNNGAKWTQNSTYPTGFQVVGRWVLATDYTHYSVVYGCDNMTDVGTCDDPHVWVWSRQQTLDPHYDVMVNAALRSACVDSSQLAESTTHGKDCRPGLNSAGVTTSPTLASSLFAVSLLVLTLSS